MWEEELAELEEDFPVRASLAEWLQRRGGSGTEREMIAMAMIVISCRYSRVGFRAHGQ